MTGLALDWLTDAFRTALDAADLSDSGGVVMRALFDASDTDVVIQLRRLPRATRAALTEGGGGDRASRSERGLTDPVPTVTAGTDPYGRGTVELETATGNLAYASPLSFVGRHDLLDGSVRDPFPVRECESGPGQRQTEDSSTSRAQGRQPVPVSAVPIRPRAQTDPLGRRARETADGMRPGPVGDPGLVVHREWAWTDTGD